MLQVDQIVHDNKQTLSKLDASSPVLSDLMPAHLGHIRSCYDGNPPVEGLLPEVVGFEPCLDFSAALGRVLLRVQAQNERLQVLLVALLVCTTCK